MWLGVLMKVLITTKPTDLVKQPAVGSSILGSSLIAIVKLDLLLEEVDDRQIYVILSQVAFQQDFTLQRKRLLLQIYWILDDDNN